MHLPCSQAATRRLIIAGIKQDDDMFGSAAQESINRSVPQVTFSAHILRIAA